MRWVLSSQSRGLLRCYRAPSALLAFDFDGTLAPIVGNPERARMRDDTRRLLRQLARKRPCVVISGRSCADLLDKLQGTGIRRVIGNHGAEPSERAPAVHRQVACWKAALARDLPPFPGIRIEDKKLSLTVHYRQCRWKAKARCAVLEAARPLPGVRLIGGKDAISLVPLCAPSKGTALREELDRLSCVRALYVGDDETDEDVFALEGDSRFLTIRVGRKVRSRAGYFIRNQREIDDLLESLIPG